jgi:hypothetical protein
MWSVAVLAIQSAPRCKLCQHAKRSEIDALLERRSNGESDETGRFNLQRILDILGSPEFDVTNPTKENVTVHWRKHCEKVEQGQVDEMQEKKQELSTRALAMCEAEFGVDWQDRVLSNDEYLIFVRICAQYDLSQKILAGEKTGATIDHGIKSVGESTKRKSNEALDEIRKGMGQALQAVAQRELGISRPALPAGVPDIIEAEPLAEEEE